MTSISADGIDVADAGVPGCACGDRSAAIVSGFMRLVERDAPEEELRAWVVDAPVSDAELFACTAALENMEEPVAWVCHHGVTHTVVFSLSS